MTKAIKDEASVFEDIFDMQAIEISYQNYAKSLGLNVHVLTRDQKLQAMLNELQKRNKQ